MRSGLTESNHSDALLSEMLGVKLSGEEAAPAGPEDEEGGCGADEACPPELVSFLILLEPSPPEDGPEVLPEADEAEVWNSAGTGGVGGRFFFSSTSSRSCVIDCLLRSSASSCLVLAFCDLMSSCRHSSEMSVISISG